jgi:hypothetical protein
MRSSYLVSSLALLSLVFATSCTNSAAQVRAERDAAAATAAAAAKPSSITLHSGTSIPVTLSSVISSKTANVGDVWTGSVQQSVALGDSRVIAAGSAVNGTVTSAKAAKKGDRAMLDLGLEGITVDGHRYSVHGATEAVVAGSTRARNLGAIAGATLAGAIIGHQVGGSDKGTVVGGLIGAGAATGVVAASEGYQVELHSGTPLVFTTTSDVAVRR